MRARDRSCSCIARSSVPSDPCSPARRRSCLARTTTSPISRPTPPQRPRWWRTSTRRCGLGSRSSPRSTLWHSQSLESASTSCARATLGFQPTAQALGRNRRESPWRASSTGGCRPCGRRGRREPAWRTASCRADVHAGPCARETGLVEGRRQADAHPAGATTAQRSSCRTASPTNKVDA